jgi:hypothetical protein
MVAPVAAALMSLIHNERVKLLATALNNLGVGAIVAGIVAPTVNGTVGGAAHILAWVVFGTDLIVLAASVARETSHGMSLQTYWLLVPLIGIGLSGIAWGWLFLTRHPAKHHAADRP